MNRITPSRCEDLRATIDDEFSDAADGGDSSITARSAAHTALDDSAMVRAIKDYIAEVEHPLQHQLYLLHQEDLERYKALALASQEKLWELSNHHHDEGHQTVSHLFSVVDAFLEAHFIIAEQESVLALLHVLEAFCTEGSALLKEWGSRQVASTRAFDDALLKHMRVITADYPEVPLPSTSNKLTSLEQQRDKFLLEQAAKKFKSPNAIQRLSYRPYDPDAVFPPNICLSRPNARTLKPSDITTDLCCVCSGVVSEYAKAAPRSHCLDCDNGHNAVCGPCVALTQSSVGALVQAATVHGDKEGSNNSAPRALQRILQACLDVVTQKSLHTAHHSSGISQYCMSYTHANVAQRYADLQQTIRAAFNAYAKRPLFGIVHETSTTTASLAQSNHLDELVTLQFVEGTYRRWTRVSLDDSPEDPSRLLLDGVTNDDDDNNVKTAGRSYPLHQQEGSSSTSSPPPRTIVVKLPLRLPLEAGRVPSAPIQEASQLYLQPDPLTTKWLTFAEVRVILDNVSRQVESLTCEYGDKVILSVNDSPLWYSIEMGIIDAKRCAVGLFSLWEGRDLLDAMQLSKPLLGIIDVAVFRIVMATIRQHVDNSINETSDESNVANKVPKKLVVIVTNEVQYHFVLEQQPLLRNYQSKKSGGDEEEGENERTVVVPVFVQALCVAQQPPWFPIAQITDTDVPGVDETPVDEESAPTARPTAVRIKPTDNMFPAIAVFTSGTSGGKPKGVTTTARQFQLECVDANRFYGICDNAMSSYAPSWATDKHNVWRSTLRGGRINFHCKTRSIFESLAEARPTPALSLVPFLMNQVPLIYEGVGTDETARLLSVAKSHQHPLVLTVAGPLPGHDSDAIRRCVVARAYATAAYHIVERVLGGRVYILSCGGAAVRADVLTFLRRNTPCYVMENYGLTECGGVLRDNLPFPGSLVKLVDRPDLGYTTSDVPFPRGEFAVKNMDIALTSEWICDESAMEGIQARYLPDGYFLTGDIGLQRPDGTYEVIDRASAVKKLANGKFFSPERVEQTIADFAQNLAGLSTNVAAQYLSMSTTTTATSSMLETDVENIKSVARRIIGCFVAADNEDHSTIRVLFKLAPPSAQHQEESVMETHDEAIRRVAWLVKSACMHRGIPKDEVPVEYFLEDAAFEWSSANGCLTASRKPNRRALTARLAVARADREQQQQHSPALHDSDRDQIGSAETATVGTGEVIVTVEDVASALMHHLVPNAPIPSDVTSRTELDSSLPDLGCDSLVLSRIPRLLGPVLLKLRGALSASLPRNVLRELTELPSLFLTTPSLMRQTPRTLAEALWDSNVAAKAAEKAKNSTDVAAGSQADEDQTIRQPFFSRQTSAIVGMVESSSNGGGASGGVGMDAPPEGAFEMIDGAAARSNSTVFNEGEGPTTVDPEDSQPVGVKKIETRISDIEVDASVDLQRTARAWAMPSDPAASHARQQHQPVVVSNPPPAAVPAAQPTSRMTVLLTGAAGYFGAAVLQALLRAPWCSSIWCIVRSNKQRDSPRDRVAEALSRFVHAEDRDALLQLFDDRVRIIEGDLELPLFGMEQLAYDGIFRKTRLDLIIHGAAMIKSWTLEAGLDVLRGPNVDGTVRIAQLSIHNAVTRDDNTATPIVYVSTVSVMKSQDVAALDGDLSWKLMSSFNDTAMAYYDAYSATKLMAENVLREWALVTNAPLRIYRLRDGC
ncbi:AMP-binding protein, putative [Bodo saltans]|uniref:AMP-binding protein, putative n=1 Tax=Bodo saltans TaxID=75058 RepID=A0A0S4JBU8_BODSA|nr:AMP-binding protein, putative [Bodo saltans]|eukprot:CUG89018.1 AMP-binding protein, putative [Bodo saltans]